MKIGNEKEKSRAALLLIEDYACKQRFSFSAAREMQKKSFDASDAILTKLRRFSHETLALVSTGTIKVK